MAPNKEIFYEIDDYCTAFSQLLNAGQCQWLASLGDDQNPICEFHIPVFHDRFVRAIGEFLEWGL